jgi:AcrR family transcriptional regulator
MAGQTELAPRRRNPLSRERVLRAAIELADREGIEGLSMRRLGQELGVEAMSLYNHVTNRDDLLGGMVDEIVGEIDPREPDGEWKSAVRNRILSARRAMRRHPWASEVIASRSQPSPLVMAYMDSVGRMLRQGGFSVDLVHHAFHALGSRVLGFSQELYDDSDEAADPAEMQPAMLIQMQQQYPTIAEIVEQVRHDDASIVGSGCDDQFEFEFALDLILDGLERVKERGAT